jgi:hypothetical protein
MLPIARAVRTIARNNSRPKPGIQDLGPRYTAFIENFTAEVHATAVAIAVVTSAVNAMDDWRIDIDPADIARFAPETGALRSLLELCHATLDLEPLERLGLDDLLVSIDGAQELLDGYLDETATLGIGRAASIHGRRLQIAYRRLACETRSILTRLDMAVGADIPELYLMNTRVLSSLLAGASNGFKPCLDPDGRLYVPDLPQKRRWPRRTVLESCTITFGAASFPAFVRDVSCGGLGLERVGGLRRGDGVSIEMASGRTFSGSIAWVSGDSAGVRFDIPLRATDPLVALPTLR